MGVGWAVLTRYGHLQRLDDALCRIPGTEATPAATENAICGSPCRLHLATTSASNFGCFQWGQYFRDTCSWKLLRSPLILGGVGKTVQIDESVMVRAKYHRGRRQLHKKQRCAGFSGWKGSWTTVMWQRCLCGLMSGPPIASCRR